MSRFFLQACLGYFSLCPSLSPSLASVLLEHRTLCFQRKKQTLSCPTSALSRTLMCEATAYGFTGVTYSLRSLAPNHKPTPSKSASNISHQNSPLHGAAICQTCLSYKRKRSRLSSFKRKCRVRVLASLLSFQTAQTQRAACLTRQHQLHAICAVLELR